MKILERLKVCLAAILAASGLLAAAPADTAYVRVRGSDFLLGNQYLERSISVRDGVPLTTQFENKLSGRSYAVSGNEFQIQLIWERLEYTAGSENPWVLSAPDFKMEGSHVADGAGGAKRLVFSLSNQDREPALHVDLVYEVRPGDPITRQWLELKSAGPGRRFVHYAAVQMNEWHGVEPRLGGFGQPIYSDDLFWGLEYPSGINRIEKDLISLGSYVGLNIPDAGLTTEKAVIGVSAAGKVQQAFFSYINSIRAQPVRPYILYNTWYDLQRMVMNSQNTSQRVRELNEILQTRYKLKLNSFVLDDGWDNMHKLWRIDEQRFPNGFHELAAALQSMGSGLGIWYGPVGGYDDRSVRIATGRSLGMEIESNSDLFCLAGRHYSEYFENSVLTMQKTYGMNFFKLDGVPFGCNEPDHGHPIGIYSRETDERVFIDLLTKLRQQKPDVFLNITTGIWLSPWWLPYADTVWMGGEDSGYLSSLPTLSPRQSALSYRDSVLYDDFVRNRLQFPISSIMTHGVIRGKFNFLGGSNESLSDWKDELVHYVSVGNMMVELYLTPELLNREEWDALAATLHWAEANQHPLLENSKMILGDPARREPYGFVHTSPEKVIVTLRNPFAEPKLVRLRLDDALEFESSHLRYRMQTVYPFRMVEAARFSYADAISIRLEAFEQRVLELKPENGSNSEIEVTGARYSIEATGNGSAMVHLYAPAGASRSIGVEGNNGAQHRFDVHFGKPGQRETAMMTSAPVVESSGRGEIRVTLEVEVPEDISRTTLAFLFEPEREAATIQVQASDNNTSVPLTTENGKGVWQWFSLDLKPGRHNVTVKLQLPASVNRGGKLSAWAITERQLAEASIPITLAAGVAVDLPAASLPADDRVEKTTVSLLEQTIH